MKYLVLDAMGVLYTAHDDVAELLHPFIVDKGGLNDLNRIINFYIETSLGKMASAEFWKMVGLDPTVEDEYLSRHAITGGLIEFLESMRLLGVKVWCLSNDVSEWSCRLRRKFGIEGYFQGFIISGDVGLRKPNPAIYELLVERLKCGPGDITFVDDNVKNLDFPARSGIYTVLFNSTGRNITGKYKTACNFKELAGLIK
ncbi:MAG: HAD family hydrolase [Dehalococcoidia bacterium]|nr:MAG: HAD family hydrolase [Dehalococcoidia bacterium]